jgi:hypothetical protein
MPPTIHTSPGNARVRPVARAKERLPAAIELCVRVERSHGNVRTSVSTTIQERLSGIFRKSQRPERLPAPPGTRRIAAEMLMLERIDVWVNEGGAGGEVNP